jgi:hypothetical protein
VAEGEGGGHVLVSARGGLLQCSGMDAAVRWFESVANGAFTEPLTALIVGIVVGAAIGYGLAAAGGFGWR